jgi:hypothetical protein
MYFFCVNLASLLHQRALFLNAKANKGKTIIIRDESEIEEIIGEVEEDYLTSE